jgi:hypothetical protein
MTITISSAFPKVPSGTVVQLGDGKLFFVKKQTPTTLTVVPLRWWHNQGFVWKFLLGMILGTIISRTIIHWDAIVSWLIR